MAENRDISENLKGRRLDRSEGKGRRVAFAASFTSHQGVEEAGRTDRRRVGMD